jgi:rhodanese-related sulfurtransferase
VPCVNEDSRILNDSTLSALLQNDNSILIVDVREIHELPKSNHPLITQIPLSVFTNNLKNIPANKTILFVCKAGMRSKKALEIFQDARPLQKSFSYNKSMNDLLNLPFFINPLFDYAK